MTHQAVQGGRGGGECDTEKETTIEGESIIDATYIGCFTG